MVYLIRTSSQRTTDIFQLIKPSSQLQIGMKLSPLHLSLSLIKVGQDNF